MAEASDRTARGRAVYASQFDLPEDDAIDQLERTVGKRMAAEAVEAAAGAWVEDCLSLRDRSLVVVVALISQGGVEPRLRTHIRWALEHGLTTEQLEAAVALLAVYIGYPRASVAMEVIRDVTGQASAPGAS